MGYYHEYMKRAIKMMKKSKLTARLQNRNPDQEFLDELRSELDAELKKPVSEQDYDLIDELTEGIAVLTGTDRLIDRSAETGMMRFREKVRKRHPRRRFRIIAAAAAAAAALACSVIGVFAYLRFSRKMAQFEFGTIGEARMAEYITQQPVTYDNGEIAVTADYVLSDGIQAMLLLTLEPMQKDANYDWLVFDTNYGSFMHNRFLIDGQEYTSHIATGFSPEALEYMQKTDYRWMVMFFTLPENASDEALANAVYRCCPDAGGDPEAEITIPVDLRKNVDTVKMRAEDGSEMTLSPFEFYMNGYQSKNSDWQALYVTWKSGKEQCITFGNFAGSDHLAGQSAVTWSEFAIPFDPDSEAENIQLSGAEAWYGIIDVREIAAFRFGNKMFYPVSD